MRTAILIVVVTACGSKRAAQPLPAQAKIALDAAVIDAAPAPLDTHEAAFAHDPSADLRALGAALEGVDYAPIAAWIDRAEAPRPDDQPFAEPLPDDAAKIGALLVAWDRSGSPARLDCDTPATIPPLLYGVRAALDGATGADDPIVHAILRFSRALESPDSAPLGVGLGVDLATRVAEWRHRRGLPETDDMRALAPTDDVPRRAALAEARCAELALAKLRAALAADPAAREMLVGARREDGLDSDDDVIATDANAAAAYLAETRALIARTPSDAALRELLDRRAERAVRDARSELARVVAAPSAFQRTQGALAQYRDAAAGRTPAP